MSDHKVPISTEIDRFKDHLSSLKSNIRILFSAPFGAGKSSFLQDFFLENKTYLCVKVFPTNYSVASNKDIFELIKFDILSSLFEDFSKYIELDRAELDDFLIGQMFALNQMDFLSITQAFAKALIPKAKEGVEVVDSVKTVFEKFSEYKKEVSRTDEDAIIEYLVSLRMQTGSIKEQDFFTQKIKEYLTVIRKKSGKEIVLVIDDLDRLDADHVFRIFNIFTAHYDSKTENNKFGFDKIVLVCDINTIEHLFFHRYGSMAEFNGYIDKFYSHYIFYFDNKKHLVENITQLISPKENLFKHYVKQSYGNDLQYSYGFNNSTFYSVFQEIVTDLIKINLIKIRNFQRFQEYSLPNFTLSYPHKGNRSSERFHFIGLMHLLGQFFPRPIDLESALFHLVKYYQSDYSSGKNFNYATKADYLLIQYSLPFLGVSDIISNGSKENKLEFISENDIKIFVVFTQNSLTTAEEGIEYSRCLLKIDETTADGPVINLPNPYWFLYKAYLECKKRQYKLPLNEF